jgi:large subunit ribosomal protein L23
MALTIYDIIKGPVISDKAYRLSSRLQQLFLRVHKDANKKLVAEALEKLFNIKVDAVRIQVRKGKSRMIKRRLIHRPDEKRAIVTLAEGYSLDLFQNADLKASSKSATESKS